MGVECPKCKTENTSDSEFCKKCGTPLPSSKEIPVTETLETPTEELATGSTFAGRYQIIEELGKGGMGKVYKVLDKEIKAKIALKLIKPEIAADKDTIERFRNELKMARDISHKNVCRMYHLSKHQGMHYITMEYVPGENLKSFVKRARRLDVGTALSIAIQVCEGLAEAHSLGIVHRDLKPGNIMIDREGNARIMDFGIARSLEAKGITGKGVIIGTPEYMSPEQVDGKEADQRSDIYSLGIILFEMVIGRVPFEGDTPLSVAVKQRVEAPQNPKELNTNIPEDLSRLILKCMEKDKANRYQSTAKFLLDLKNIEKGIPTQERVVPRRKPITSKEITVKFSLKKVFIPALIILACVAIAGILFWGRGLKVDPNLVAVAIFENQTGDKSLDPLGRMVSDWITQGLSQTGMAEVVPTMTILQYSSLMTAETSAPQDRGQLLLLAEETGAGTLVSGVYYLADEEIQFHASITDAQRRKLIHSIEPVKGSVDKKMEVIQALRETIMSSLAIYFNKAWDESTLKLMKTPIYEAYREFVLGAEFFGVDYPRAIQHFARAAEIDSSFILPRLYIASAYLLQGDYAKAESILRFINQHREQLSPIYCHSVDWHMALLRGQHNEALRFIRLQKKLAPKEITINYILGLTALLNNHPQESVEAFANMVSVSPEILYSIRMYLWRFEFLAHALHMLGNYKQELKEVRKGQKYYPNILWLRAYEARALAALGKIDAVREVIDESLVEVSSSGTPGDVMLLAAQELREQGHKEAYQEIANRAVEWYKDKLQMKEVNERMRHDLATALYTAERWGEAQAVFEELAKDDPENIEYKGRIGVLAARKGERDKALEIFKELESVDRPYLFGVHTYMCARIASLLGEKEQAVFLLRNAFAQGLRYGAYLHYEMDLEPLRDYKPFQELLRPKG